MKVANIIIAHKNPGQLLRLVKQFEGGKFHHFIHIDGRCNLKDFQAIVDHRDVTLLPVRRKLNWTGFGFVRVTIEALYLIRNSKEHFFYTNLMSGMDFPVRPTNEFYDFLHTSYNDGCPEFFEILDLSVWPGAHRYERYHLIDWTIKGRYFTERIINKVIPKRKFYDDKLVPYGRAAWFTASDHFVTYALDYFEKNPDYLEFLKSVWCPDEFIYNALIMASPFRDKISPYLRYIDWSEGKVNPKVFRASDKDAILNSGCYLARKFDETIDKTIIDYVEAAITNKP